MALACDQCRARAQTVVKSGADFVAVVADPSVTEALLVADIRLHEEDFAAYPLPLRLTRNLTLTAVAPGSGGGGSGGGGSSGAAGAAVVGAGNATGSSGGGGTMKSRLIFDADLIRGKMQLANGIRITVRGAVLLNWFTGNYEVAPHVELLEPLRAGEWASVVVEDCLLPIAFCWPPDLQVQGISITPRPRWMPGSQTITILPPQPGCVNATQLGEEQGPEAAAAVPLQSRCWVQQGVFDDLALLAFDLDPVSQKQIPHAYGIRLLNTEYVCFEEMGAACIADLGTFGCINAYALGMRPPPPRATKPPTSPGGGGGGLEQQQPAASTAPPRGAAPGGGRGGGGGAPLGAVVGGAAGGGAALAALAVLLVWRRQRGRLIRDGQKHPQRRQQQLPSTAGGGRLPGAPADGADGGTEAGGCGDQESGGGAGNGGGGVSVRVGVSGGGSGGCYTAASEAMGSTPPCSGGGGSSGVVEMLRLTHVSTGSSGMANTSARAGPSGSGLSTGTSLLLGGVGDGPASQRQSAAPTGPPTPAGGDPRPSADSYTRAAAAVPGGRPPRADPLAVVSPLTPLRPDLRRLDAGPSSAADGAGGGGGDGGSEVALLPTVLGRGAFGRVVEGRYMGRTVAVKLLLDETMEVWGFRTRQQLAQLGALGGGTTDGGDGTTEGSGGGADGQGQGQGQAHAGPQDGELSGTAAALLQALSQEVEVLGRCHHPNIVTLLAACLTPPRVCLVLERCDTSLDRLLYGRGGGEGRGGAAGGGPQLLPMDQVLSIAIDVARGLEYLHPTVVHRDLKPGNVLINNPGTPRMVAKLSDFGLSRLRSTVAAATENPEAGTPEYMAPELYVPDNNIVTHKVDVYSFGVLLWSMLSGKRPWEGLAMVVIAVSVTMHKARPPLEAIPPHRLPAKLVRLLHGCWDVDPERRPAAAELVKELLLVQEQGAIGGAAAAAGSGLGGASGGGGVVSGGGDSGGA